MRILVIAPQTAADVFFAHPFFCELRSFFRGAHITVVSTVSLKNFLYRDLIDEVVVFPGEPIALQSRKSVSFAERFRSIELLKEQVQNSIGNSAFQKWDIGFNLSHASTSDYLLWRLEVKRRIGWKREFSRFFLTESVVHDTIDSRHRSDHFLKLLDSVTSQTVESEFFWDTLPENPLDPVNKGIKKEFDAHSSWPAAKMLSKQEIEGSYIVFAPWGESETQTWPLIYSRELLHRILEETSYSVCLVGHSVDAGKAHDLLQGFDLKRVRDYVSKGTVQQYADLFRQAEVAVVSDSVWGHLGALCSPWVQLIWGGYDPSRTRPLGPAKVQIAVQPVDCWPCNRNVCVQVGNAKFSCLKETSVDLVWGELSRGFEYTRARKSALL